MAMVSSTFAAGGKVVPCRPSYLNFYYIQSVIQLIGEGLNYVISRLFNAMEGRTIGFGSLKIMFSCSSDFGP